MSTVSFLEVEFLAGAGRLEVRHLEFVQAVGADPRFVVDEPPLVALVERNGYLPSNAAGTTAIPSLRR